ncbi:VOC family protein [Pedobacter duraquae]|uniref:Putative 3-demethylubiquinone-9 3-methyltransferase (Glyoxalase superfamily) n=1 Tax=Pedobacter duraquae TaxID=425511 RepID=A0A4V3C358_9SPHI|nr:VOC family protein [Pedobacter duraquae]TDO20799.1 putative 3-demethylubiquinone-9 3-methyltransferase (glyoxalase superfamily) [Pedobacter duraquae]
MQPIKAHLWFNRPAHEAAEFYTTLMPDSAISFVNQFSIPGGECEVVEFTFAGYTFLGISGEAPFKISPSISFMINFDPSRDKDAIKQIDELWSKLIDDGKIMMPLDHYPFSERYGWVADKYGVNWQLMLTKPEGEQRPAVVPSLMYTGEGAGRAEEAIDFYCSVFKDGKRGISARYPGGMAPDQEGTLMYADFNIDETWLAAMDSAHQHDFTFNEAVSLLVTCDTQEEIDYCWSALSAGGTPGQCGWLKDKFGVSWQVSSAVMFEVLKTGTPSQVDRVIEVFRSMTKVDVAALQQAFDSN